MHHDDDFDVQHAWRFRKHKTDIVTPIRPRLSVNTSEAAVEAAVAGAGIARVISYKMETDMRERRLAGARRSCRRRDPFRLSEYGSLGFKHSVCRRGAEPYS